MAMDSFILTSNTNNSETKNESGVNHQSLRPIRYCYQNGDSRPEDNTPLQAQQEDTLSQRVPFESSTSETSLAAVVPSSSLQVPDVAWTEERTLDSDIPQILSVLEWNTSTANGAVLTAETTSTGLALPSVHPVALPYHLCNNNNNPDGGYQVNAVGAIC